MTETRPAIDFSLPNVGPGPDPCSLADLATEEAFVAIYLQRDHLCTNCRTQVQDLKERYDEFRQRDAEIVSVVPEPREKVQSWQESYDLPYPLLADPDASAGETFDQPVRFGFLGSLSDFLGRMPVTVVADCRGDRREVAWSYSGSSTWDRPDVGDVFYDFDDHRDATAAEDPQS
jgi:peroxiredoxin Q/BCP